MSLLTHFNVPTAEVLSCEVSFKVDSITLPLVNYSKLLFEYAEKE